MPSASKLTPTVRWPTSSRLEALENAEIKYDESNAAFTKGVEDCIGKALANDGAIPIRPLPMRLRMSPVSTRGTMQDPEKPHRRPAHGRGSALSRIRASSMFRLTTITRRRSTRSTCPEGEARPAGGQCGGDDLPRYARRGCRTARGRLCRRARIVLAGNGAGEDALRCLR